MKGAQRSNQLLRSIHCAGAKGQHEIRAALGAIACQSALKGDQDVVVEPAAPSADRAALVVPR
jgi:hypothetical protein